MTSTIEDTRKAETTDARPLLIAQIGGNVGPESVWFSTERAYEDAFVGLGHKVIPIKQGDLCHFDAGGATDVLLDRCGGLPDLVVYTRTHNDTALLAHHTDMWRDLEDKGSHTAGIHLDVFWGIPEREQWMREGDPLFTTEAVFTADGGSDKHWAELGIRHVWLPPAADLRRSKPFETIEPNPDLFRKIVFVGSEGYHKRYAWRPKLIAWLRQQYGDDFVQYGNGSPNGTARGEDLDRIYASDCVVVGDHCFASEGRRPNYWSDRTPETLGRGGLLLQPTTSGMGAWYTPDDLIYWPTGSLLMLADVISLARDMTPEERLAIRRHGAQTVWDRDTYPLRARTVLDHFGLN